MINFGFIDKPGKAADIGNKKQALISHFSFKITMNSPS
jgi:hypothetical protein